jgi:hypothetical protein
MRSKWHNRYLIAIILGGATGFALTRDPLASILAVIVVLIAVVVVLRLSK